MFNEGSLAWRKLDGSSEYIHNELFNCIYEKEQIVIDKNLFLKPCPLKIITDIVIRDDTNSGFGRIPTIDI